MHWFKLLYCCSLRQESAWPFLFKLGRIHIFLIGLGSIDDGLNIWQYVSNRAKHFFKNRFIDLLLALDIGLCTKFHASWVPFNIPPSPVKYGPLQISSDFMNNQTYVKFHHFSCACVLYIDHILNVWFQK